MGIVRFTLEQLGITKGPSVNNIEREMLISSKEEMLFPRGLNMSENVDEELGVGNGALVTGVLAGDSLARPSVTP